MVILSIRLDLARCQWLILHHHAFWNAQGYLGKLEVSDSSVYTISPPRIWGTIPRLARCLGIDRSAFLLEHTSDLGLMLSVEFFGAEAEGFQAETGNFIRR